MRLRDKVSIITGGCGGIGRAIAVRFLEEGSIVVLVDAVMSDDKNVVQDILNRYAEKVEFFAADVSQSVEVNKMADEIFKKFGKIDILVNCAGIYEKQPMMEMSDEDWDKTIKINLNGCFYCSRAVANYMKSQQDGGSIINMSSIGGQTAPSFGHSHYAASKAGMMGFTRAIALELGPYGIRTNNICPGVTIDTPMGNKAAMNVGDEYLKRVPLGRHAVPSDIADGAVYLASDESSCVTGTTLSINGGAFMN